MQIEVTPHPSDWQNVKRMLTPITDEVKGEVYFYMWLVEKRIDIAFLESNMGKNLF